LQRAIEKAGGDRERALRNVCRAFGVKSADRLPSAILTAAISLIADS